MYVSVYNVCIQSGFCLRKNPKINGIVWGEGKEVWANTGDEQGMMEGDSNGLLVPPTSIRSPPPSSPSTVYAVYRATSDPFGCKAYKLLIAIPQNREAILYRVRDFFCYILLPLLYTSILYTAELYMLYNILSFVFRIIQTGFLAFWQNHTHACLRYRRDTYTYIIKI